MGRAGRVRNVVRGPAGRSGSSQVDAGPDPARRRRAGAGKRGPRLVVRAVFARTARYQPAGLRRRGRPDGGGRGLRAVHAEAAVVTLRRAVRPRRPRPVTAARGSARALGSLATTFG